MPDGSWPLAPLRSHSTRFQPPHRPRRTSKGRHRWLQFRMRLPRNSSLIHLFPNSCLWDGCSSNTGPKTCASCLCSAKPPWRYRHALDTCTTRWMASHGLSSTRAEKLWFSSGCPRVLTKSSSNWRTRCTNRSQVAAKWWSSRFLLRRRNNGTPQKRRPDLNPKRQPVDQGTMELTIWKGR